MYIDLKKQFITKKKLTISVNVFPCLNTSNGYKIRS